jgi:bifunctional pyridoxal-dependent enzyme with beta-cystathionase and maltose regulon repressor activities
MSIEKFLIPKDHDKIIADLRQMGVDEVVLGYIETDNKSFNLFRHFWQNNWIGLPDEQKVVEVNQLIAFILLVIRAEKTSYKTENSEILAFN